MVITDIVEYSCYITIFLCIHLDWCFNAPMRTEGEAHEDDTELKMDRELTHHCKWSLQKKKVATMVIATTVYSKELHETI